MPPEQVDGLSYLGGLACLWMVGCLPFGILGALVAQKKHAAMDGFFLGILFGPFGFAASFALDYRPQCPHCGDRLGDKFVSLCPHCNSRIGWVNGKPTTVEQQQAAVERQRTAEQRLRVQDEGRMARFRIRMAHAQRRREALWMRCKDAARAVLALPEKIDRRLEWLAGEENELVYRFLQGFVFGALPVLIVVVAVVWLLS